MKTIVVLPVFRECIYNIVSKKQTDAEYKYMIFFNYSFFLKGEGLTYSRCIVHRSRGNTRQNEFDPFLKMNITYLFVMDKIHMPFFSILHTKAFYFNSSKSMM